MRKYLYPLFFGLVLLDQITKVYVKSVFKLYESVPVVDGLFNLTYVLNPGAAFGFLGKLPETFRRIFFVVITLVAIAAVLYLLYKEYMMRLRALAYTLILSGAVGNFIDRVYLGKVVDFLDFYVGTYHWPAFNVADSAISVGICLLTIDILFIKRENNGQKA